MRFSQYLDFFAPSDSRFSNSCISAKYCPILTNHASMESLFIPLFCINLKQLTFMTDFVVQGHICSGMGSDLVDSSHVIIFCRWFLESARWLVLTKRSEQAVKNLKTVARINGRDAEADKINLEV